MTVCCVMATPERLKAKTCLRFVPDKRAFRGSHFCSRECHSEYRRLRRAWKATKACRLCGRGLTKGEQEAAVRGAHNHPQNPSQGAN